MRKAYILSSCTTCQRILRDIDWTHDTQNIKVERIDEETLDMLYETIGSYEGLFNKRSMKYRTLGLNKMELTEQDYRKYILQEYTFLKRPVFVIDKYVFAGNGIKTIASIKAAM